MRLIVDECIGPSVAHWLRGRSMDVYSVYEQSRGMTDEQVLAKAVQEDRILITNDKDFGDMIYREKHTHRGIVLLRLSDPRPEAIILALDRLLNAHAHRLANAFIVITEQTIRISEHA